MREKYRFDLQDLLPIGVTLIVVGLVLAFGLQILGEVKGDLGTDGCTARTDGNTTYNATTQLCNNGTADSTFGPGAAFNGTVDAITGVAKFPSKLPLIATVVVAVVIIGILIRYFTNK
jgi:hypothetical protein